MRNFAGVKAVLAHEFSGWLGDAKRFKELLPPPATGKYHRTYTPSDIRRVRRILMEIPDSVTRPRTLPPIINARMAKGGTGKTTITGNLGACLAMFGHRVCLIDSDPQGSLTGMFGINTAKAEVIHIGELMRRMSKGEPTKIEEAAYNLYEDGMLDLIGADITMASIDSWLMGQTARERCFQRLLEAEIDFFSKYDVILIDSPPSSSLLTTTTMAACKMLLAVVAPEPQCLKALDALASSVNELNDAFPGLNLGVRIAINRFSHSKRPHVESLNALRDTYPDQVEETIVRDFIGFVRQMDLFVDEKSGPLIENEPYSVGARDIIDLTKSLIRRYGIQLAGRSPLVPGVSVAAEGAT